MLSTKVISETDAQEKQLQETWKRSNPTHRSLSSVGGSTFALHEQKTMTPIDT